MTYKLVGEDDELFHVEHPDGSRFSIAKQAVGPHVHKMIKGLEPIKMADGGNVEEDDALDIEPVSQPMPDISSNVPLDIVPAEPSVSIQQAPVVDRSLAGQPLSISPVDQANPVQPIPQIQPIASPAAAYREAFKQQTGGIQGIAKAKTQEGQEMAKIYEQQQREQQAITDQYEARYATNAQEHDSLVSKFNNGQIDPNRLWSQTSTGNKVLAGIGILLSGIGSGLTGQQNMAMNVIDRAIDRDIDAQKANLGKTQTLLSLNAQQYRTIHEAELATRLQINASIQSQLMAAAARSGSAQAQASAQFQLGQLKMQAASLNADLARQGLMSSMAGAGTSGGGGMPVNQAPAFIRMDPKAVEINNRVYFTRDPKEAADQRDFEAKVAPVIDMVRRLEEIGSATMPLTAKNEAAQAIRARLAEALPMLHGYKRFNEKQVNNALDQVDDPTKFKELIHAGVKTNEFFKTLEKEVESERKSKIVGYQGAARYGFQQGLANK